MQRITDFGAFVEILPGIDGLLHVSEIAHYRVREVRDELNEGDQVLVKVINVDPSGKVRLSRKALLPGTAEDGDAPAGRDDREGRERRDGKGRPGGGRAGDGGRTRVPPRAGGDRREPARR